MKIKEMITLPYQIMLENIGDEIGWEIEGDIVARQDSGDYISDTDIDEMIKEQIGDWYFKICQESPEIREDLFLNKLKGDGFHKDLENHIKDTFEFRSDDSRWYDGFDDYVN